MFDFPIAELITPEEQVAVARCVAIMASKDEQVSDSERHFVEELMGQMMLLPEERDLVRRLGAPYVKYANRVRTVVPTLHRLS